MKKELKSIEVSLIGCSEVKLNASDTATDPIASYALDSFGREEYMQFKNGDTKYFVPFHAVDHIIVKANNAEVEDRPNPYGCEPDGTVGGSKVGC